jgi:hypothetical protein
MVSRLLVDLSLSEAVIVFVVDEEEEEEEEEEGIFPDMGEIYLSDRANTDPAVEGLA